MYYQVLRIINTRTTTIPKYLVPGIYLVVPGTLLCFFSTPFIIFALLSTSLLLRGRAGDPTILYDFFPVFFVKIVFLQRLYCSQYNRAAKTRLTANGKRPEPKLVRTCSLS